MTKMAPSYQSVGNGHDQEASSLLDNAYKQHKKHKDSFEYHNDYDNITSTNNSSLHRILRQQITKKPTLILVLMLLLACTVGHTLTVMYYWEHIKKYESSSMTTSSQGDIDESPSFISPVGSATKNRDTEQISKKKAQEIANEEKKNGLDIPTIQSELYYNRTASKLFKEIEEKKNDHDSLMKFVLMGKSKSNGKSDSETQPPPPPPPGCQSAVMIVRHCEKGGVREHCNSLGMYLLYVLYFRMLLNPIYNHNLCILLSLYTGFERAQYISTLFGNADERWPAPSKIFALAPGERNNEDVKNYREIETVTPLSQKVNVTINDSYGIDHKKRLSVDLFEYLRSGEACGKLALISWKHQDIPSLAHRLGCGPDQGCPVTFDQIDFDSVWEIRYTYKKPKYAPYPEADATKKKYKGWGLLPEWRTFGKVEKEAFDPLAYDKKLGIYN